MIIMDASVLIHYLRYGSSEILTVITSQECGICGITRAEILHGAKDLVDVYRLQEAMRPFISVAIPDTIWDQLGLNLMAMRRRGLPMPVQDVLLVTVAIDQGAPLWSFDSHFLAIQSVLPKLTLFTAPGT